jgi:hypothetical protein
MPKLTHPTKGTAEGRLLVESKRKSPVPYKIELNSNKLILDARTIAPIKKKYETIALKGKYNYDRNMNIYISDTYSAITYNGTSITLAELITKESCVATFNIGIYLFTFSGEYKSLQIAVIKFDAVSTIVTAKILAEPSAPVLESIINPTYEFYANELFDMPVAAQPITIQPVTIPNISINRESSGLPIVRSSVSQQPRRNARSTTRPLPIKKPTKVNTLKHSETLPPAHFLNLIPEENRICSICTECIANDSYLTKCYHLFHKTCIEKWVAMKGSAAACPVCRVV